MDATVLSVPQHRMALLGNRSARYIAIAIVLLTLIVSVRLYYLGEARIDSFITKEKVLAAQVTKGVAAEIQLYLDARWRLLDVLMENSKSDLEALAAEPAQGVLREQVWRLAVSYFPEASNFSLIDDANNVMIDDFSGRIGNACRADVSYFLNTGQRRDAFIHSNPLPDDYHFDILGRFGEDDRYVFMVAIGVSVLERLLRTAEFKGHSLFLTRGSENRLIDLSTRGVKPNMGRAQRLGNIEIINTLGKSKVPGTEWSVVDVSHPGRLDASRFAFRLETRIEIGVLLFMSFLLLLGLWYSDRRRQLAELSLIENQETLELRVEESTYEAQQASRAKAQFLSTVSHEMLTPMNGITGAAQLLQDTKIDSQQRQYLNLIFESARKLLGMVHDILELSRIGGEKLVLHPAEFEMQAFLLGVKKELQQRATAKGLKFLLDTDASVNARYYGDNGRLIQVLMIFGYNAVKFTEHGVIHLNVSALPREGGVEDILRFEMVDTGAGVPEAHRQSIFEDLSQADSSTTRKYGGAGLGLGIARRVVEAMGGSIGLESDVGVGSTFWIEVSMGKVEIK